ncbi:MAG: hypothetical protein K6C12_11475 [Oscillospiraceae bacterium]|nr:hypothetical protein [Oscillospiraceae bacterium]
MSDRALHCEIGGYLELERFTGPMLHEEAAALSSGRGGLSLLIRQKQIRKIALPDYLCDVVRAACEGAEVSIYPIGADLKPGELHLDDETWLYLVNYFGQLSGEEIREWGERHPRLIVDNAQAYFDLPVPGIDTIYTCRKFLGVADGGFLYTDAAIPELPEDESHGRMGFVLGRFERPAEEYYAEAAKNNDTLPTEARRMSPITRNLLHAVDYDRVKIARTENFRILHGALGEFNLLPLLRETEGAYAYPLMLENGAEIRRKLIGQRIFVPRLWPNVLQEQPADSTAYRLTEQILPLPCDQRYGREEMDRIIQAVTGLL